MISEIQIMKVPLYLIKFTKSAMCGVFRRRFGKKTSSTVANVKRVHA